MSSDNKFLEGKVPLTEEDFTKHSGTFPTPKNWKRYSIINKIALVLIIVGAAVFFYLSVS